MATNALLEGKGARTALITTRGFRDLLEIARQKRPHLYDLQADKTAPLVPRDLRLEVRERLLADGSVLDSLRMEEADEALTTLSGADPEAIAVCFLYSFLDPTHERQVAARIRERLPGCYVSLSSEVSPEFREYERLCHHGSQRLPRPLDQPLRRSGSERTSAVSEFPGLPTSTSRTVASSRSRQRPAIRCERSSRAPAPA